MLRMRKQSVVGLLFRGGQWRSLPHIFLFVLKTWKKVWIVVFAQSYVLNSPKVASFGGGLRPPCFVPEIWLGKLAPIIICCMRHALWTTITAKKLVVLPANSVRLHPGMTTSWVIFIIITGMYYKIIYNISSSAIFWCLITMSNTTLYMHCATSMHHNFKRQLRLNLIFGILKWATTITEHT